MKGDSKRVILLKNDLIVYQKERETNIERENEKIKQKM